MHLCSLGKDQVSSTESAFCPAGLLRAFHMQCTLCSCYQSLRRAALPKFFEHKIHFFLEYFEGPIRCYL